MSTWVDRTTKQYFKSKSPTDMAARGPLSGLIQDSSEANALFAAGVPSRYWNIVGELVTEMSQAEKDVVDAAEALAITVDNRDTVTAEVDEVSSVGTKDRAMIELHNKRANFLINRVIELQDALLAMAASTGSVNNLRAAIPASFSLTATRAKPAAVQDYKDDINAGNQDIP